ncbi:DNA polymerase-3 subunit gamma/tau [Maridesulfovibrio ferrireducens]|uniref:DNA polymerase III subunit gamma/tau n=1 Tax=Maridesulfovibrio ferrireducens TaxID=246191 RepID=A0A1G9HHW5_9BACT|nr:DNA polymerase III subunit gamma/tau [Maridesulfovibrio ferrireducens]SDL12485.1 DNA polymerase-3 subunit gamma/tau [Maridesulfovibrio ferrireducens]
MSTSNLTAKYRPQTFAEVAGQNAVKTILSRAAAQDKIAPAYLLSGTRGVGKTTIARIFAKALNCVNAPTAEPCNVCENCRQITAGIGVDVIEIDAASHGKVDDARRLKEDIGYAPIEFRYKVFIIDEAHMLTTQAFNALLKTLEEPPGHATFIMATTETHKFPATIISRCQHYVFKMLTSSELTAHLSKILQKENIEFESGAVDLIAKRGAGSVRDSMSLLGQVLALGSEKLLESDVRSILGLAGRDVFFSLMQAIHSRDLVSVGEVVKQVLDRGLDLGFFIRELGSCWRNMFLLGQSGERAIPLLDLSSEEAKEFMHWATTFDRSFVHACWQMTVDGQRKVMTSLEPAMALELLLLNMASLSDLISVERAGALASAGSASSQMTAPAPKTVQPVGEVPPWQNAPQQPVQAAQPRQSQGTLQGGPPPHQQNGTQGRGAVQGNPVPASSRPMGRSESGSPAGHGASSEMGSEDSSLPDDVHQPDANNFHEPEFEVNSDVVSDSHIETESENPAHGEIEITASPAVNGPRDFEGFLKYVSESGANGSVTGLANCKGLINGNKLVLTCANPFHHSQVGSRECKVVINRLAAEYFGSDMEVEIVVNSKGVRKSRQQLRAEVEVHPVVVRVVDAFGASIISVDPRRDV